MGQGSAKNLATISGVTVTGTPSIGQVLTATSTSNADWQNSATPLPLVFQPSGTAETNVFITEAPLNTATNAAHGPQTVYLDFSHSSQTYTPTGSLNLGDYIVGVMTPNSQSAPVFSSITTQITTPVEIHNVVFEMTQSTGNTLTTEPINLDIYGSSFIQRNSGAGFFFTSTGAGVGTDTLGLHDFVKFAPFNTNPVISITASGNLVINMFDASSLGDGAVTITAGGALTINVFSPSVSIGPTYIGMTGVTIVYGFGNSTSIGGIQAGQLSLASGVGNHTANINSSNTIVMVTLATLAGGGPYANQYVVTSKTIGGVTGAGQFAVTAVDTSGVTVTTDNSILNYLIIG